MRGWRAGAPIDLSPLRDDPALGANRLLNDKFRYEKNPDSQEKCPFAAHTRKTNPRADITSTESARILRHGIQFGPEVTADEAASNRTTLQRGLLFVCYQSSIENGFQFIQKCRFTLPQISSDDHSLTDCRSAWSNNTTFPPLKSERPGFDPITGQTNDLAFRTLSGTNPEDTDKDLLLDEHWVVTKGGEYFFSPSIRALKETFAQAA